MDVFSVPRDFLIWDRIAFNAGTLNDNIEKIYSLPTTPVSAYICLVGVPMLVDTQKIPELIKPIQQASMVAVDGMPIVKRARKLGLDCDRFSGPDFADLFFRRGIDNGKKHFFYGCSDDVLLRLQENLLRRYPDICICGAYAPPYRELTQDEDDRIVQIINAADPDFLWVGLGGRKQEVWMYQHRERVNGCVMLGVGALFNYLAGTLAEMPEWMEQHSLGWFFRLIKEPRRLWRRYILGGFMYIVYNVKYSFSTSTRDRLTGIADRNGGR